MSTYSFLNVKATINGPGGAFTIGGDAAGASDEGVTAEYDEDKDTLTAGADGDIMHSLHASKAGKMTVRLLKTSPVNAQLSQLYAFQTSSSANHGQNTITVADVARGDLVSGRKMAFTKHAGVTWAKDGNFNEWVFSGIVDFVLGAGVPDVNAG
jgi:hypothetical protein